MNLSVSYNEAFYESDFVEQFIDMWRREFTRALGVEEHVISTGIAAMVPCGEMGQEDNRSTNKTVLSLNARIEGVLGAVKFILSVDRNSTENTMQTSAEMNGG